MWQEGDFELIVCPQLINEVTKALLHHRIGGKYGITREEADSLADRLAEDGILLEEPVDPPRVVPDDPKDDYLVALATAAGADALVTRDRHFEKVKVKDLPILTPREMVRRVRRSYET